MKFTFIMTVALTILCLPHSPLANEGDWILDKEQSRMSDKYSISATKESSDSNYFRHPKIRLSCSEEEEMDIVFVIPDIVHVETGLFGLASWKTRIDDKPPVDEFYNPQELSDGNVALTRGLNDRDKIKDIANSKRILLQYYDGDNQEKVVEFDMTGIKAVIGQVMDACGIKISGINCSAKPRERPCRLMSIATEQEWQKIQSAMTFAATIPIDEMVYWNLDGEKRSGSVRIFSKLPKQSCYSFAIQTKYRGADLDWCVDTGQEYTP